MTDTPGRTVRLTTEKAVEIIGPLSPRELAILRWTDAKDEARHRRMMRLLNGGVSR